MTRWTTLALCAAMAACGRGEDEPGADGDDQGGGQHDTADAVGSNGGPGGGNAGPGGGDSDAPAPDPTFTLAVTPASVEVRTGPDGGDPVTFTVDATWSDDTTGLPGPVTWSLANDEVGTIDASGVFTPSAEIGGVTEVIATVGGEQGRATVTSQWVQVLVDDDVDPSWFLDTPASWDGTSWTYPEDATVLPSNVASIPFAWTDVGARGYRLEFSTDVINLTVYAPTPSWEASAADWARITRSHAGRDVTARLWASFEDALWEATPLTLSVDAFEAEGSVIYWSTSVSGMVEIPFGGEAQDFFTGAQAGSCVGCHVVSSQGYMAYNRGGSGGTLGLYDVSMAAEVYTGAQASTDDRRTHFSTFSPDGSKLLTAFGGAFELLDGTTGAHLADVLTAAGITQPDWSPDGTQVAFVRSDGCGNDIYLCRNLTVTIERMAWNGTGFEAPEVIYTAPANEMAYYPTHSPDGAWIVFNRSTGDSYDDPDATLWVIPSDGSADPVALEAANRTGNLYNSWPKFAPAGDQSDTFWVTFASRRAFQGRTLPQIWISAFDPVTAAAGQDPSAPAFWLAGQNPTQKNHIPSWVEVSP